MLNFLILFLLTLLLAACSQTFYIVRHAEKAVAAGNAAMMNNDPPLTEPGKQRAEALKEILKTKKIGNVFSTNTIRTRATAEPARAYFNLVTEIYPPVPDSIFISRLQSLKKNTLIVGHSNTVDDIVNKLCGSIKIPTDLRETEYDNLFIVKKKGREMSYKYRKYGIPSH